MLFNEQTGPLFAFDLEKFFVPEFGGTLPIEVRSQDWQPIKHFARHQLLEGIGIP